MSIYDWQREPLDWEWHDDEIMGMDWPWPQVPLDHFNHFYEPCSCCDLGTVYTGPIPWECPACAGSGIGRPHEC